MENYSIITLIGEGSYGKVFKATENESKNTVALKIILKRGRSSKEISYLRQEAQIQQNLCHPNIIKLLDSFETEKEIVFVTEYAVSDLHKLLAKEGSLGETKAQKFTFELTSALYYLHSHRILHRDLKPPNILLDKNKTAKLCDFGLARHLTLGTQVLTSIKGTPLYMAPELLEAKPYGHEADLWSLGCIIYEMLAGETPFNTRSILHLARLIKYAYIKWPSFLSGTCISFLKGLLVNDPQKRMTWPEILDHKFVKGHILILSEDSISESPFTSALSQSQHLKKEKQTAQFMRNSKIKKQEIYDDNILSSRDSIKAIIQSDMEEVPETDLDEDTNKSYTKGTASSENSEDANNQKDGENEILVEPPMDFGVVKMPGVHNINFSLVPENNNLVINRFYDNFPNLELDNNMFMQQQQQQMLQPSPQLHQQLSQLGQPSQQQPSLISPNLMFSPQPPRNHPMAKNMSCFYNQEIKKLSQDLDNFSLRIDKSIDIDKIEKSTDKNSDSKNTKSDATQSNIISTDESINSPVENEEWLQFLCKSMQEILDGELDIYKQENMITMIVALLRNSKANLKVIDYVSQILCLPYAIDMPPSILDDIERVYVQVKLVPNLVYASKLLCSKKFKENCESSADTPISLPRINGIVNFNESELSSLSSLYDLVCYLVYSGETFLHQFCDALSILDLDEMFISFIVCVTVNESNASIRLASSICAIFSAILKNLPENAKLIENVIFNEQINLESLLKHGNSLIRYRAVMLLRLLGRFCCYSLQNIWSTELNEILDVLICDSDEDVRNEATNIIEEFKSFSFYL